MNALFQIKFRGKHELENGKKSIIFDLKVGRTEDTVMILLDSENKVFDTKELVESYAFEKLTHLIEDLEEITEHLFSIYKEPAFSLVIEELQNVVSKYEI